jgi:hypothetical protein
MAGTSTRHAQLQEHRRVIDEQRIHLRRQQRQIDLQVRRTADVQAELDVVNATANGRAYPPTHAGEPQQRPSRRRYASAHVRNDFFNRPDLIGSALERTRPPSENACWCNCE